MRFVSLCTGPNFAATLVAVALLLAATSVARGQSTGAAPLPTSGSGTIPDQGALPSSGQAPAKHSKHSKKEQKQGDIPQVKPNAVIPVGPLGFAPPASFYLGNRYAQVSLNFLDEDSLLFTFRVPGLIAREQPTSGQAASDDFIPLQRHIKAVVLSIPDGKVNAEALWMLHDYSPYLWMLKDGKFLLRDRNVVQEGDASLHLEPYLRFPGPVSYLEFDPSQRLLVADSDEPAVTASGQPVSNPTANSGAADASAPSTALAKIISSGQTRAARSQRQVLRVFRMDTREVMLLSRTSGVQHLPVDGEGYYETEHGSKADGSNWMISYEKFRGGTEPLMQVDSTCNPALDVESPGVVLASACNEFGGRKLVAIARDPANAEAAKSAAEKAKEEKGKGSRDDKGKHRLWEVSLPPTKAWPLLVHAADAPRFARATLEISHNMGITTPLDQEDIRGQDIQVYDLATGKMVLNGPASPVLDAGGNFALSPSGRRFAVLNAGQIQVYDLPPVPPLAERNAATP